jgi:hypothetical protein
MSGFQTSVKVAQAPAIAGDWASANPRFMFNAGPFGLVAGAAGVNVGRFAWVTFPPDGDGAPSVVNSFGSGAPDGLVHREQQGLITGYLSESANTIYPGAAMALAAWADMWVKNDDTVVAYPGMTVYADVTSGKAKLALSGTTATTWAITAATATFTGSIADNVMTAGTVTGTIYAGSIVTGAGVASGTKVIKQLTGNVGAAGTYIVSPGNQSVASEAITLTYGALALTTVSVGKFVAGQTLTGASAGVTAGTVIGQILTGDGGSGSTATVNLTQSSAQGAQGDLTGALNVATSYYAQSQASAGEVYKISPLPGLV